MKQKSLSLHFRWVRCPVPTSADYLWAGNFFFFLIKVIKRCCLAQTGRKPRVLCCRANETIQFTGVLISTSQESSTSAQGIHLSREGFKRIAESCWGLATYFREPIVSSDGINGSVRNKAHLHITSWCVRHACITLAMRLENDMGSSL